LLDPAGPRSELAGPDSDHWSIGVVLFHLLFGVHPLYFLPDLGRASIGAYLKAHSWPDVPPSAISSGLVTRELVETVDAAWAGLPDRFRYLMSEMIENGWLVPARRPDAGAWIAALAVPLAPPRFTEVSVSRSVVLAGGDVTLSWATADAHEVEIVGLGRFPPSGQTRVRLQAPRQLELCAHGSLGTATTTTRRIDVMSPDGGTAASAGGPPAGGPGPGGGPAPGATRVSPGQPAGADPDDNGLTSENGRPPAEALPRLGGAAGSTGFLSDAVFDAVSGGVSLFPDGPLQLTPPAPFVPEPGAGAGDDGDSRRAPGSWLRRKTGRRGVSRE
jgi:hypothetical protein